MAQAAREHWSGRAGFLLAAIGSAVGLGNMWRFSYLAAENGGAGFVLLYLGMTLVVGLPVLLAELAVGRGAQRGPIRALAHFGGERWKLLGLLFVAAGFVILAYYSVIAGWTLRYGLRAVFSGFGGDASEHFARVATGAPAIAWHLGFMALTTLVVAGGIKGGIERSALVPDADPVRPGGGARHLRGHARRRVGGLRVLPAARLRQALEASRC